MKQCKKCNKQKRADNCIECAQKYKKQVEAIVCITNSPAAYWRRVNFIEKFLKAEGYEINR